MEKIKEWWPLLASLAGMMAVPLVIAGIYITSVNGNIVSLIDAQNRSIEEQFDAQNRSIEAQFDAQNQNADARYDAQIQSADARYEGLMERFEGLKEQLEAQTKIADARYEGLTGRVEGLQRQVDALQSHVEGLLRQFEGLNLNAEAEASYESLMRGIESAGGLIEFVSVEIESIDGPGHVDKDPWAEIYLLIDAIHTVLEAIVDRGEALESMIDAGDAERQNQI